MEIANDLDSASSDKSKSVKAKSARFPYAIKSFIGYLEGTGKSRHTISSYRTDLKTFEKYLKELSPSSRAVTLDRLTTSDIEKYHNYLKKNKYRTNTRRRKVLTVRRLLRYLFNRKKFNLDISNSIPAPYKVEKVPATFDVHTFIKTVWALKSEDEISRRNRNLLLVLGEAGCLVSEVGQLKISDLHGEILSFRGKFARNVHVSKRLAKELKSWNKPQKKRRISEWMFQGANRHGLLGTPITSRGVELIVKSYGPKLQISNLSPRMIRHSVVLSWLRSNTPKSEVQRRLGLKSDYAFRSFGPLLNKKSE